MAGEKLPNTEVNKRVEKCLELRYNAPEPMGQLQWVEYCHEHYGDKSEQQYCAYWAKARERYEENWKELLNKQLTPAVLTLIELMSSEDEKVRQRAVDQVMKYTGNEIDRQEVNVTITEIDTTWG